MKKNITVHFLFRVLPFVLSAVLLAVELSLPNASGRLFRICCYLWCGPVLSIVFPLPHEEFGISTRCMIAFSLFYLLSAYPATMYDLPVLLVLMPSLLMLFTYRVFRLREKYSEVSSLFRRDVVWCEASEDSRSFYILLSAVCLAAVSALGASGSVPVPLGIAGGAVALLLDFLLHRRSYTGHTVFLSKKKERRIQGIITSNSKAGVYVPEVEVNILAQVYKKVTRYMKTHRPFLDDGMTLDNISDAIKVNKLYISRAINHYAGKNFRQYVNHYRVMYSVELMKQDPWLKVIELSFMSGFHSVVTYNLAFRMVLDETPSEMLTRIRLAAERPGASRIEVVEPEAKGAPSSPDEQG